MKKIKCNQCNKNIDEMICVFEEVSHYVLTDKGVLEFEETVESDAVQYLCPKCKGILDNGVVSDFKTLAEG